MPAELATPGRVAEHKHEQRPCPRCDSTNTKFCYYNNYNLSQPRHFCKSCRRYWTHGGTLRDVPIGGSSRKTAKRLRSATVRTAGSQPPPLLEPIPAALVFGPANGGGGRGFSSLLSGFGVENVGFGLGRGFWAFPEVGYNLSGGATVGAAEGGGGHVSIEDTWQVGTGVETGLGGAAADYFASLPELPISSQGHGLK